MWRPVVSSKSENNANENRGPEPGANSLRACLVEGDPAQLARDRRSRRRSMLISVAVQITVLAALILVPILSRTERITLANIMPMPPYHRAASTDRTIRNRHQSKSRPGLSFCLTCPPVLPPVATNTNTWSSNTEAITIGDGIGETLECSECAALLGNTNSQPALPRAPTPRVVHVTRLDPAMLLHRVEPIFPILARQTGREGTVELHAIIAIDGSVRSLQVLEGDALFYQSALDAVRQWRYKPTLLNGNPVEVDTHITVIYRVNH
jgi:protein TonB